MLIYRNAEGVYGQRTFENPWSKMLHKLVRWLCKWHVT